MGTDRALGSSFVFQLAEFEVYPSPQTLAQLSWTAPGDNGNSGTAASYEVRYRVGSAINAGNWGDVNTKLITTGVPLPAVHGAAENMTVDLSGFTSGNQIYF